MASIPSPRFSPPPNVAADQNHTKFALKFLSFPSDSPRRRPNPLLFRCHRSPPDGAPSGDDSGLKRWDSWFQDTLRNAVKRWDEYVSSCRSSWSKIASLDDVVVVRDEEEPAMRNKGQESGDWDWERWKRFFVEVEEMEGIVLALKSQLQDAILREDYEDAVKLKLAIDAATTSDIVRHATFDLNRAIKEERYNDAVFIRDCRGAGLVGWWAGVSDDGADPFGRIVKISAEHGRYVAKSYSPRQLASGRPGFPLFEVYFALVNGEYKNQAVYLKHSDLSVDYPKAFESRPIFGSLNSSESLSKGEDTLQMRDIKLDEEKDDGDTDDVDMADGLSKIQNVLRDMIPGVKVKVLKVVSPGKVDKDLIAKVIEQIVEEDEEGSDDELETTESEDIGTEDDTDGIADEPGEATSIHEENNEVSLNVVISAVTPKVSGDPAPKNLARIPASLKKRGHSSFSLILEKDAKQEASRKAHALRKKTFAHDSTDLLMSDLAKVITGKDTVHIKVLKNIGELINYAVNQKQNFHSLSGVTSFSRIQVPSVSDPLSGLYVGTHGMYSSNVLHLRRKYGHWKEDNVNLDLEFYEYVEAVKLTGDPSVPAGQVAFRAKVGKQNQLPHKGIIPEEFGVVARYRGQGKLAEPGYQNPRWVDGELVILDGKFIRGGPVIGFVYWAPESHFLLFFNRLRLPD